MKQRKRIALFASFPETNHVRRITDGIMRQCEKYDYDLCVFAASAHLSFPDTPYVRAESSIYELANFDKIDGVILDPITLTGDEEEQAKKRLLKTLKAHADIPILSASLSPLKYQKSPYIICSGRTSNPCFFISSRKISSLSTATGFSFGPVRIHIFSAPCTLIT